MQFIVYALSSLLVRVRGERGQDLLEYALLGGLIAAAVIAAIGLGIMTGAVSSMVTNIGYCVDFAKSTTCGPF